MPTGFSARLNDVRSAWYRSTSWIFGFGGTAALADQLDCCFRPESHALYAAARQGCGDGVLESLDLFPAPTLRQGSALPQRRPIRGAINNNIRVG